MVFGLIQLNAQNKEYYKDIVYLKNDSKIVGQLLDYKIGEKVEIRLSSGQILSFPDSVVKKIEIYSPDIEVKEKPVSDYVFKDRVFYNNFGVKLISGSGSAGRNNISHNGFAIEYSLGYRYNNYFSVGVGTAVENFNYGLGELFFPVYFDFYSFYRKSRISPFVRLQAGYGFVIATKDNVIDKEGGITFSPAFGIKYPGLGNLSYMFDINFKYQKANFVYTLFEWNPQILYRDVIFRRISFRFSIMF